MKSVDTVGADAGVLTESSGAARPDGFVWNRLPAVARAYVAAVSALGAACIVAFIPHALPRPGLFAFTLLAACLTSVWKVPLPNTGNSTLSVSFGAGLLALMLLGPELAIVIVAIGAWVQCSVNVTHKQPLFRTVFSVAVDAITMASSGFVYRALGGSLLGGDTVTFAKIVTSAAGTTATYFCVNTSLVAAVVGLSMRRRPGLLWRHEFLWSAASFMVSGAAGAAAAVVIARDQYWSAILWLAPAYVVYWTYRVFIARLADHNRRLEGIKELEHSSAHLPIAEPGVENSSDAAAHGVPRAYTFGPYRLDAQKRRLWKADQLIALTPKALDTLLTLIRHAGHVVDRDDLLQAVWPDTFVTEETLTQNIATIRRALGDSAERPDYVATVPRRGYRFIGMVTVEFGNDVATRS